INQAAASLALRNAVVALNEIAVITIASCRHLGRRLKNSANPNAANTRRYARSALKSLTMDGEDKLSEDIDRSILLEIQSSRQELGKEFQSIRDELSKLEHILAR